MSCTLVWQIKPKNDYKNLPFQLRCVLEKNWSFPCVVGFHDIPYLKGLRDAGIEGANELIELINKFEEIELNIEC